MDSQDTPAESQSPQTPASPDTHPDVECTSLPDIENEHCSDKEISAEEEERESVSPPKRAKRKTRQDNTLSHSTITYVTIAPKITSPCSAGIILGSQSSAQRRYLSTITKERSMSVGQNVRVTRNHWDFQVSSFKFAMDMKAGRKMREDDIPITIPKFRLFLRAFERRWVGWGVQWIENANQTPRIGMRSDLISCLAHTFPAVPSHLQSTFEHFCDYYTAKTTASYNFCVTDVQQFIPTFCPDAYYIVHYCMVMGIPSFLICLYLLDVFLAKECYVAMLDLEYAIECISKSVNLEHYCDWCLQTKFMVGHYVEPFEVYTAVFRIVDVISLGIGKENNS